MAETDVRDGDSPQDGEQQESQPKLNLDVNIERRSACERHVRVAVPRDDIDKYFDKEFSELVTSAQVPGFRPGHAPRKLIENRFRKQVADKVKASLLMDSISQLGEREDLSAISEPDFDADAVTMPDDGPLLFEFDLEVRPEFDLPQWKGMKLNKPVKEFGKADVDRALSELLSRRGRLVPFEGAASLGDYIVCNLTFSHDGKEISKLSEQSVRVRKALSLRDGKLENFGELVAGQKAGGSVSGEALVGQNASNAELRGKKIAVQIDILEVKKLEVPELTDELLAELGDFKTEGDLRDAIKESLEHRLEYQQRRDYRKQITDQLLQSADWDLPPGLLKRQSRRELQRAVLELQRSGFSEDEIRSHEAELRLHSQESTATALKEHFILEKIAEQEKIVPTEDDYEEEIRIIALRTNQSARRVRAKLEKEGAIDVLHNQVVERKVIDDILANAQFEEVPFVAEDLDAEAIEQSVTGEEAADSDIPEAKPEAKAPEEA